MPAGRCPNSGSMISITAFGGLQGVFELSVIGQIQGYQCAFGVVLAFDDGDAL